MSAQYRFDQSRKTLRSAVRLRPKVVGLYAAACAPGQSWPHDLHRPDQRAHGRLEVYSVGAGGRNPDLEQRKREITQTLQTAAAAVHRFGYACNAVVQLTGDLALREDAEQVDKDSDL